MNKKKKKEEKRKRKEEEERKRKRRKKKREKREEWKKKKRRKKKKKNKIKSPSPEIQGWVLDFSDLPRFPLGFRCLAENCMQFFLFFLQKASRFEKILHIKYVDKGMKGGI